MKTEISLLIHHLIIGEKCYPMFSDVTKTINLNLVKSEQSGNGCIWAVYRID